MNASPGKAARAPRTSTCVGSHRWSRKTDRILLRGGLFMYPQDTKDAAKPGSWTSSTRRIRSSFIVEQAGGGASTGRERVLDVGPDELHQRVGLIFGSREEVERIEQYHRDRNLHEYDSPLFSVRGLFRAPT